MMKKHSLKLCKPSLTMTFDSVAWNKFIRNRDTNCYTYALNAPRMGWSHPGQLSHTQNPDTVPAKISVRSIKQRLEKDGLRPITKRQALSGQFHAIAFWVRTGGDFHFLRRDAGGTWSHKMGCFNVTDIDDRGRQITDPSQSTFFNYPRFGGFFCVPKKGIRYVQRLTIPRKPLPFDIR